MSPELIMHLPYTLKTDIWSLGCLLYEMCTFEYAFCNKDNEKLIDDIKTKKL